jgi:hypothetical protein
MIFGLEVNLRNMSVSLVNNKDQSCSYPFSLQLNFAVVDPLLILKHYGILDLRQVPW